MYNGEVKILSYKIIKIKHIPIIVIYKLKEGNTLFVTSVICIKKAHSYPHRDLSGHAETQPCIPSPLDVSGKTHASHVSDAAKKHYLKSNKTPT